MQVLLLTLCLLNFKSWAQSGNLLSTKVINSPDENNRAPRRFPSAEIDPATDARLGAQKDFFRKRKGWQQALGVEREIWVDVEQTRKNVSSQPYFDVRAVGAVKVPSERIYRDIQKFEKLSLVSENFKKVVWNEPKKELFLWVETIGYESKLLMDVDFDRDSQKIILSVREGTFAGMKAIIDVDDFEKRSSLITFNASLANRDMPLPPSLMAFALEVLAQKVAQKMRTALETDYGK